MAKVIAAPCPSSTSHQVHGVAPSTVSSLSFPFPLSLSCSSWLLHTYVRVSWERERYSAEREGVRHAPSTGGGDLLIHVDGVGRGVEELHGKMKVAPSWSCDLICSPFCSLLECLNLTGDIVVL